MCRFHYYRLPYSDRSSFLRIRFQNGKGHILPIYSEAWSFIKYQQKVKDWITNNFSLSLSLSLSLYIYIYIYNSINLLISLFLYIYLANFSFFFLSITLSTAPPDPSSLAVTEPRRGITAQWILSHTFTRVDTVWSESIISAICTFNRKELGTKIYEYVNTIKR